MSDYRPHIKYDFKARQFSTWVIAPSFPKFVGMFDTMKLANEAANKEIDRMMNECTS